ncbi:hypothetical protein [Deinococcus alpinitundrae]|uniref:hypothetical protein n=1 Tax=Deinococcus alpinitundrae TaxID=468913 RepID=UPI00137A0EB3|nr:hypothetical protein [Deinococcus alpinitundrae]
MNKIQRSIDAVLAGKLQIEREPNYCLKADRQVIEDANGWAGGEWYKRMGIWSHFTALNKQRAPTVPWARSMEQAFIDLKWTVPVKQARAGDVVFSRLPSDFGHIGLIGEGAGGQLCVLENATVRRGQSLDGSLNWVPLEQWGGLTTVGRMPDVWVFDVASPAPVVTKPAPVAVPTGPRVLVENEAGGWDNVAGQRITRGGVTVNATDPGAVWIALRGEA